MKLIPIPMFASLPFLLLLAACQRDTLDRYGGLVHASKSQQEAPPGAVTVSFFGTTSLLITDGTTSIMADPFFTRGEALRWHDGSLRVSPSPPIIARSLERAGVDDLDAVLVSHSHLDHALDAPEVARRTGALLVGSESTLNIARGWGLSERQLSPARRGEPMRFGRFTVTFVESAHGSFLCSADDHEASEGDEHEAEPGGGPLSGGAITTPLPFPARFSDFVEGTTYAIHISHPTGSILFQPSAGYLPGALSGYEADVVFLGIARVGNQDRACQDAYFNETVGLTGARRVVPVHWDNWARSLDEPLRPWVRVASDFESAMSYLMAQRENGRIDELTLMRAWQSYTVYD